MENDEKLTLAQAHEKFAKSLNGKTWELLGKTERTRDEDELMVLAASASLYHWLQVGTVSTPSAGNGCLRGSTRCWKNITRRWSMPCAARN